MPEAKGPQATVAELLRDPSRIAVPAHARVREIHKGFGDRLILLVEDAHSNLSAQQNLAQTIGFLMENHGVDLIFSEGSSRDASLGSLRGQFAPAALERSAKRLLFEGLIAGHEYLNLTSGRPMSLIGVEDASLYRNNLESYAELAENRDAALAWLRRVRASVRLVKDRLYPQAALEHEKTAGESAAFMKSFESLIAAAAEQGVAAEDYPQIQKLIQIRRKEKSIDWDALREGGAGPVQAAYDRYLKDVASLEFYELLEESSALEEKIYSGWLGTGDTGVVRAIDRYAELLEKAFQIQMSSDEYALWKQNADEFQSASWQGFLNRKLTELGLYENVVPEEPLADAARPSVENFYAGVARRDEAFLRNAERELDARGAKAAFLVVGGYHAANLTRLLRERGWSYAVLAPDVDYETDFAKYEKILLAPVKLARQSTLSALLAAEPEARPRFADYVRRHPEQREDSSVISALMALEGSVGSRDPQTSEIDDLITKLKAPLPEGSYKERHQASFDKYWAMLDFLHRHDLLKGKIFYPAMGHDVFPGYFGDVIGLNENPNAMYERGRFDSFHQRSRDLQSVLGRFREGYSWPGSDAPPSARSWYANLFDTEAYTAALREEFPEGADTVFLKGLGQWAYDGNWGWLTRDEKIERIARPWLREIDRKVLRPGGTIVIASEYDTGLADYLIAELGYEDIFDKNKSWKKLGREFSIERDVDTSNEEDPLNGYVWGLQVILGHVGMRVLRKPATPRDLAPEAGLRDRVEELRSKWITVRANVLAGGPFAQADLNSLSDFFKTYQAFQMIYGLAKLSPNRGLGSVADLAFVSALPGFRMHAGKPAEEVQYLERYWPAFDKLVEKSYKSIRSGSRTNESAPGARVSRETRIRKLVREIALPSSLDIEPAKQINRIRRLSELLHARSDDDLAPLDAILVYGLFAADDEKAKRLPKPKSVREIARKLEEALGEKDPPEVEIALVRLIERLGDAGKKVRLDEALISTMILGLIHSSEIVRFTSIRALSQMPARDKKKALSIVRMMAENPATGRLLIFGIVKYYVTGLKRETGIVANILRFHDNASGTVIREAAKALGKIAKKESSAGPATQAFIHAIFRIDLDDRSLTKIINELAEKGPVAEAAPVLFALMAAGDSKAAQAADEAIWTKLAGRFDQKFNIPSSFAEALPKPKTRKKPDASGARTARSVQSFDGTFSYAAESPATDPERAARVLAKLPSAERSLLERRLKNFDYAGIYLGEGVDEQLVEKLIRAGFRDALVDLGRGEGGVYEIELSEEGLISYHRGIQFDRGRLLETARQAAWMRKYYAAKGESVGPLDELARWYKGIEKETQALIPQDPASLAAAKERFAGYMETAEGYLGRFYASTPLASFALPDEVAVDEFRFDLLSASERAALAAADIRAPDNSVSSRSYRVDISGRAYQFGGDRYLKFTFPNGEAAYLYDNHNLFYAFAGEFLAEYPGDVAQRVDHYDDHDDAATSRAPMPAAELERRFPWAADRFKRAQIESIGSFLEPARADFFRREDGWKLSWILNRPRDIIRRERGRAPVFDRVVPFLDYENKMPGGIASVDLDVIQRGTPGLVNSHDDTMDEYRDVRDRLASLLSGYQLTAYFIDDEQYINPVAAIEIFADHFPIVAAAKLAGSRAGQSGAGMRDPLSDRFTAEWNRAAPDASKPEFRAWRQFVDANRALSNLDAIPEGLPLEVKIFEPQVEETRAKKNMEDYAVPIVPAGYSAQSGVIVGSPTGYAVFVRAPKGSQLSLLSRGHRYCSGYSVYAERDGEILLGHYHLHPLDAQNDGRYKFDIFKNYLTVLQSEGWQNMNAAISVRENPRGFALGTTSLDLEKELEAAGVNVLPAVVRDSEGFSDVLLTPEWYAVMQKPGDQFHARSWQDARKGRAEIERDRSLGLLAERMAFRNLVLFLDDHGWLLQDGARRDKEALGFKSVTPPSFESVVAWDSETFRLKKTYLSGWRSNNYLALPGILEDRIQSGYLERLSMREQQSLFDSLESLGVELNPEPVARAVRWPDEQPFWNAKDYQRGLENDIRDRIYGSGRYRYSGGYFDVLKDVLGSADKAHASVNRVLEHGFRNVPRHEFVPRWAGSEAYEDWAIHVFGGQTVSQPFLMAMILAALDLKSTDSVLEIGAGSGWLAAWLSQLSGQVRSVERSPYLTRIAELNIARAARRARSASTMVIRQNGFDGYPEAGPYNAIIVSAEAKELPWKLGSQLAEGGKLIIPINEHLKLFTKTKGELVERDLFGVGFVPLIQPDKKPLPAIGARATKDDVRRHFEAATGLFHKWGWWYGSVRVPESYQLRTYWPQFVSWADRVRLQDFDVTQKKIFSGFAHADPELGLVVRVPVGVAVVLEAPKTDRVSLLSAGHEVCSGLSFRAEKGDKVILGHYHLHPKGTEIKQWQKFRMFKDYVEMLPSEGWKNISVQMNVRRQPYGFGESVTAQDLESRWDDALVRVLPSVVREGAWNGWGANSDTIVTPDFYAAKVVEMGPEEFYAWDWDGEPLASGARSASPFSTNYKKAVRENKPDIFKYYDIYREPIRPLLQVLIRRELLPRLKVGSTVLEVGSGIGELRHGLLDDELPSDVRWIESDADPALLESPRPYATEKTLLELPSVPVEPGSVDVVAGMSMLDTVLVDELDEALVNLYGALTDGGELVHFLDIAPNPEVEVVMGQEKGWVVFPVVPDGAGETTDDTGVLFVDRQELNLELTAAEVNMESVFGSGEAALVRSYSDRPLHWMAALQSRGSFEILRTLQQAAQRTGAVRLEIPSLKNRFHERLRAAAERAGFEDISFRTVEVSSDRERKTLEPGLEPPAQKNVVIFGNGMRRFGYDEALALENPDVVKIQASLSVLTARKRSSVAGSRPSGSQGRTAESNSGFTGGEEQFSTRFPEQLVARLAQTEGDAPIVVVDAGMATGKASLWVVKQNPRFRVLGIERSAELAGIAAESAAKENTAVLNVPAGADAVTALRSAAAPAAVFQSYDLAGGFRLADASVDGLIVHRMRDQLTTQAERDRFNAEMIRILKPGGLLSLIEDMKVDPSQPEGEWYAQRYAVSRKIVDRFKDRIDVPLDRLSEAGVHPMVSLRYAAGGKPDESSYFGRENELIQEIEKDGILIRGVGLHQERTKVVEELTKHGLEMEEVWDIRMPQDGERLGHSIVMTGMLFRKKSDAAGSRPAREGLARFGIRVDDRGEVDYSGVAADISWAMDQIRPIGGGAIVEDPMQMLQMPGIALEYPIEDLPRINSSIFFRGMNNDGVYLGLARVDGIFQPVVVKKFPSFWSGRHRAFEMRTVQANDQLGVGPQFYGPVMDSRGEPVGYAMQLVIGRYTKLSEYTTPGNSYPAAVPAENDRAEIRSRVFGAGLYTPSDEAMLTRTGRLVSIDALNRWDIRDRGRFARFAASDAEERARLVAEEGRFYSIRDGFERNTLAMILAPTLGSQVERNADGSIRVTFSLDFGDGNPLSEGAIVQGLGLSGFVRYEADGSGWSGPDGPAQDLPLENLRVTGRIGASYLIEANFRAPEGASSITFNAYLKNKYGQTRWFTNPGAPNNNWQLSLNAGARVSPEGFEKTYRGLRNVSGAGTFPITVQLRGRLARAVAESGGTGAWDLVRARVIFKDKRSDKDLAVYPVALGSEMLRPAENALNIVAPVPYRELLGDMSIYHVITLAQVSLDGGSTWHSSRPQGREGELPSTGLVVVTPQDYKSIDADPKLKELRLLDARERASLARDLSRELVRKGDIRAAHERDVRRALETGFRAILKTGAIVASEDGSPRYPYYYNWMRDSWKYATFLIRLYEKTGNERLRAILDLHFQFILQSDAMKNPDSQRLNPLGHALYDPAKSAGDFARTGHSASNGEDNIWGNQGDGSAHALRAINDYWRVLEDQREENTPILRELQKLFSLNLDSLVSHLSEPSDDLWEEISAEHHIYNTILQLDVLQDAVRSGRIRNADLVRETKRAIVRLKALFRGDGGFVRDGRLVAHLGYNEKVAQKLRETKPDNLDASAIGGLAHVSPENRYWLLRNVVDAKTRIRTILELDRAFKAEYSVNRTKAAGKSTVFWGRYAKDIYNGDPYGPYVFTEANPWYLISFWRVQAFAELARLVAAGEVAVNKDLQPLLKHLGAQKKIVSRAAAVQILSDAAEANWNDLNALIQDKNKIPEQFDRYDGRDRGVRPLVWSHWEYVATEMDLAGLTGSDSREPQAGSRAAAPFLDLEKLFDSARLGAPVAKPSQGTVTAFDMQAPAKNPGVFEMYPAATAGPKQIVIYDDAESGTVVDVPAGSAAFLELSEGERGIIRSFTHACCFCLAIRATHGKNTVLGHAHLMNRYMRSPNQSDVYDQWKLLIDYLRRQRETAGWTDIQISMTEEEDPVDGFMGFPKQMRMRELEVKAAVSGIHAIPSFVRDYDDDVVVDSVVTPGGNTTRVRNVVTSVPAADYRIRPWEPESRSIVVPGAQYNPKAVTIAMYNPFRREDESWSAMEVLDQVLAADLGADMAKEIVFVIDNAPDRVVAAKFRKLLERRAAEINAKAGGKIRMKIVQHAQNRGKGAAIRSAIEAATGEIFVTQDTDEEYKPSDLAALLKPFFDANADVVYGQRQNRAENTPYKLLYYGSHAITWLRNILYFSSVGDDSTGYKLYRTRILKQMKLVGNRFDLEPELTSKVLKWGYRVHNVPITPYVPRTNEQGKSIRWTDGLLWGWKIIQYRFVPSSWFYVGGWKFWGDQPTVDALPLETVKSLTEEMLLKAYWKRRPNSFASGIDQQDFILNALIAAMTRPDEAEFRRFLLNLRERIQAAPRRYRKDAIDLIGDVLQPVAGSRQAAEFKAVREFLKDAKPEEALTKIPLVDIAAFNIRFFNDPERIINHPEKIGSPRMIDYRIFNWKPWQIGVYLDPKLGIVAHVSDGYAVFIDAPKATPVRIYSPGHLICTGFSVTAERDGRALRGYFHMFPVELNRTGRQRFEIFKNQLEQLKREGWRGLTVGINPPEQFEGFAPGTTARTLEEELENAGIRVLPSVVRPEYGESNVLMAPDALLVEQAKTKQDMKSGIVEYHSFAWESADGAPDSGARAPRERLEARLANRLHAAWRRSASYKTILRSALNGMLNDVESDQTRGGVQLETLAKIDHLARRMLGWKLTATDKKRIRTIRTDIDELMEKIVPAPAKPEKPAEPRPLVQKSLDFDSASGARLVSREVEKLALSVIRGGSRRYDGAVGKELIRMIREAETLYSVVAYVLTEMSPEEIVDVDGDPGFEFAEMIAGIVMLIAAEEKPPVEEIQKGTIVINEDGGAATRDDKTVFDAVASVCTVAVLRSKDGAPGMLHFQPNGPYRIFAHMNPYEAKRSYITRVVSQVPASDWEWNKLLLLAPKSEAQIRSLINDSDDPYMLTMEDIEAYFRGFDQLRIGKRLYSSKGSGGINVIYTQGVATVHLVNPGGQDVHRVDRFDLNREEFAEPVEPPSAGARNARLLPQGRELPVWTRAAVEALASAELFVTAEAHAAVLPERPFLLAAEEIGGAVRVRGGRAGLEAETAAGVYTKIPFDPARVEDSRQRALFEKSYRMARPETGGAGAGASFVRVLRSLSLRDERHELVFAFAPGVLGGDAEVRPGLMVRYEEAVRRLSNGKVRARLRLAAGVADLDALRSEFPGSKIIYYDDADKIVSLDDATRQKLAQTGVIAAAGPGALDLGRTVAAGVEYYTSRVGGAEAAFQIVQQSSLLHGFFRRGTSGAALFEKFSFTGQTGREGLLVVEAPVRLLQPFDLDTATLGILEALNDA